MKKTNALLFIVSAPSGAGKTSLINQLRANHPESHLSLSHTTRAARHGEQDGREYRFISTEDFQKTIDNNGFAEYAKVHQNYYGTPKSELAPFLEKGQPVISEVDWQGARSIRKLYSQAVSVFINAPSIDELEKRLKKRGKDSEEVINKRLAKARVEMEKASEFDFMIINDDFALAYQALEHIYFASKYLQKNPSSY